MDDKSFEEEYKRIFDSIHAGGELKKKVLEQKRSKRSIRPAIAAIGSAAAAIVIFAAVSGYDFDRRDDGVILESAVSGTESPGPEHSAAPEEPTAEAAAENTETGTNAAYGTEPTAQPKKKTTEDYMNEALRGMSTAAPAAKQTAPPQYGQTNITESPRAAEIPAQRYAPEPENGAAAVSEPEPTPEPVADQEPEQTAEANDEPKLQRSLSRGASPVILRMNSPALLSELIMSAEASVQPYGMGGEYHIEEWENDRYFDYIGTDILDAVDLSDDMKYLGGDSAYFTVDSSGVPYNDTRIFAFSGDGGRYAGITTSRGTTYVDTLLSEPDILQSNIGGVPAVVFGDEEGCSSYMKYNGTSYIVNTVDITEQELGDLLLSIVEYTKE